MLPGSESSKPPFSSNSTALDVELALESLEELSEDASELDIEEREESDEELEILEELSEDNAELDTEEDETEDMAELEDVDPDPLPPPQAVSASSADSKLNRIKFNILKLL